MRKAVKTGIYFSHPVGSQAHTINYRELYKYIKNVPVVTKIWDSTVNPISDEEYFTGEITSKSINRIIIAGYLPGYLKSIFSRFLKKAGEEAENISLVELYEHPLPDVPSTEIAKSKLICAIYDVPYEAAILAEMNPSQSETLVIGGGIAGIQAALDIANSHNKVYLVEKTGTIGGHMAMFDKTFPTLDCAACILTPKMVEVSNHPFIELMTYSEIKKISGIPGNYSVNILQKARRVNVNTCTGCGTCAEKCPGTSKSEFDAGTTMRKAIYMPFPQAVPNKYLIDADSCRYVQNGKCGVCVKNCPVENCINLDEKDKEVEVQVGNIVVATGFKTFNASRMEQYGYGKYPNVLTSLELERLVNAAGPTGGKISFRTQDKKGNWVFTAEGPEPKSVAIIHCVGSRDENYNKYCSRVCCMYSLKLAHLIKEKLPDAEIFEHYIDMRAFGKGYEEFYDRILHEGIHIIRGKTAKIEEHQDKLLLRTEDIEHNRILEQEVEMVILSVGLEPNNETGDLASILGIGLSANGWLQEANSLSNTTETSSGGIFIAGTCQGPKDIPDSVVQASAAASGVIQSIMLKKTEQSMKNISLSTIESKARELSLINGE
ncbi:MAG: CoB--CoM heterodisulfide reductase iron-sulfur subunit A family protein [Bacteroidales bacterium]|nr:CoB--CoM heterodisulfide reductase iron-sulfur subunit A family protein [Bacteroidales bacterium]